VRKSKRRSPTLSLTSKSGNTGSPLLMMGVMKSPLPSAASGKGKASPRARSSSFGSSVDIPRTPSVKHGGESPLFRQATYTPPGSASLEMFQDNMLTDRVREGTRSRSKSLVMYTDSSLVGLASARNSGSTPIPTVESSRKREEETNTGKSNGKAAEGSENSSKSGTVKGSNFPPRFPVSLDSGSKGDAGADAYYFTPLRSNHSVNFSDYTDSLGRTNKFRISESPDNAAAIATSTAAAALLSPIPGEGSSDKNSQAMFRVVTPGITTPREANDKRRFTPGARVTSGGGSDNGGGTAVRFTPGAGANSNSSKNTSSAGSPSLSSPSYYFPFMKYGLNFPGIPSTNTTDDSGLSEELSNFNFSFSTNHPPTPDIVRQVGLAPLSSPSPVMASNSMANSSSSSTSGWKTGGAFSDNHANVGDGLYVTAREFIPASLRQPKAPSSGDTGTGAVYPTESTSGSSLPTAKLFWTNASEGGPSQSEFGMFEHSMPPYTARDLSSFVSGGIHNPSNVSMHGRSAFVAQHPHIPAHTGTGTSLTGGFDTSLPRIPENAPLPLVDQQNVSYFGSENPNFQLLGIKKEASDFKGSALHNNPQSNYGKPPSMRYNGNHTAGGSVLNHIPASQPSDINSNQYIAAANTLIKASGGPTNNSTVAVPYSKVSDGHIAATSSTGMPPSSSAALKGVVEEKDINSQESKKRSELVESPGTRVKFKDFYRQLRVKEKDSFHAAKSFGLSCIDLLPEKIHWRVYLELADLAKRENRFDEARELYKLANTSQPYAAQAWLEHSKMEEECGELLRCQQILYAGLAYCGQSENILIKIIKHEERKNNLPAARAVLSRVQNMSIDKAWRTVLEGALLEARAGNIETARKVFKYLMVHVPWYGPIYCEAYRIEEHYVQYEAAIEIIERGLNENPRYGPLWFGSFRLYERLEIQLLGKEGHEMARLKTNDVFKRAVESISKELIWKVYFELAQREERYVSTLFQLSRSREALSSGKSSQLVKQANLTLVKCREAYVQSIILCPVNLRWKGWLASARTELIAGRNEEARLLLNKALEEVPDKSLSQVLLECSRLEEYQGHIEDSRLLLSCARTEAHHEWKVFLESVLVEMRANHLSAAVEQAYQALAIHTGTGRLWAVLIQLMYQQGGAALSDESGRKSQIDVFQEALREVPKSGEVWCEGARIHMNPLLSTFSLTAAGRFLSFAIQFTPQYGDSFIEYMRLVMLLSLRKLILSRDAESLRILNSSVELKSHLRKLNTIMIERKCLNADPNYGSMWFYCKRHPSDGSLYILNVAKGILADEIADLSTIYIKALEGSNSPSVPFTGVDPKGLGTPLLDGVDFCMGFKDLNQLYCNLSHQSNEQRFSMLFGCDQISA
jgi:tetratricopeptide (TPR) repeat protein